MISLEGLTLSTGRQQETRAILRTFARYIQDGLIPRLFPEDHALERSTTRPTPHSGISMPSIDIFRRSMIEKTLALCTPSWKKSCITIAWAPGSTSV